MAVATRADPGDHIRGSSLLLVGRVFAIAVNMGFQVVLIRYLSQADYGVFAYGMSIAGLVQTVVSLGQERSASRFLVMYEEAGRPDKVLGTVALYLLSVLCLGAVSFAVVVAAGDVLVAGLDSTDAAAVVATLVVVAPLQSVDMLFQRTYAAFGRTRSIFLKKHIVNPLLKLAAILFAAGTGQSLQFVAATMVASSLAGVVIYAVGVPDLFRSRHLWPTPLRAHIDLPIRDVLRFSVPLMTSPFVWVSFDLGATSVLAASFDSVAVAGFKAVTPVARLNLVVATTFGLLFLPTLARLVVRNDPDGVRAGYWRTSAWVALLSLPALLVTVPLAGHTVQTLFGARYTSSVPVLAIVAIGMYVDVVFGFNRQVLELYGRVGSVMASDLSTIALHLTLTVLLVPVHGPTGAAVAMASALCARNLLNQLLVVRLTPVTWFQRRYAGIYADVVASVVVVWFVATIQPSTVVAYATAVGCTLATLRRNRRELEVIETFPELRRIPIARHILS